MKVEVASATSSPPCVVVVRMDEEVPFGHGVIVGEGAGEALGEWESVRMSWSGETGKGVSKGVNGMNGKQSEDVVKTGKEDR